MGGGHRGGGDTKWHGAREEEYICVGSIEQQQVGSSFLVYTVPGIRVAAVRVAAVRVAAIRVAAPPSA